MSEMNVADFLRLKLSNMQEWLGQNGCEVQMPSFSNTALCLFAQSLHDTYDEAIRKQDFDAILADKENFPLDMLRTVTFVREHPQLHEKFWRYLSLFSKTMSICNNE
tara:strand:+ start:1541 stop:1861 length:321 start_codon:yes stop_codon:yes gene_type:complete